MNPDPEQNLDPHLEVAYRLLSACLYQPSPEWLAEDVFGHLGRALSVVAPAVAEAPRRMAEALQTKGETALTITYARLFVGPGKLGAPPYGSYYLEPEKQVMGESTMAVRGFYEQAGLVLEGFSDLPDHLAVELEFLSYLLQQALSSAAGGDGAAYSHWVGLRKEFLSRFVSGWFEAFCAEIRGSEPDAFYLALADCLEAVVRRDLVLLSLADASHRGYPA
jgi:putative dimethyl sulfoxide reductase chaperone